MSIRALLALAAVAAVGTLAAPALAQQGPPMPMMWHGGGEHHDPTQMLTNRFFDRLDPDRTGKITRSTYLADAKKTFDRLDVDKAGKLTKSEILLAESHHHGGWGMHPPMHGAPMHRDMMAWHPKDGASPAPYAMHPHGMFADIPRDASGAITLEAYMKWAGERFDAIDTGHTGTITVPMYRAYIKSEMAKRPKPTHMRRPLSLGSPAPAASK